MGMRSRLRETLTSTLPDPMVEVLEESIADLNLRLEDRGWKRVGQEDEDTLSRDAIVTAAQDGRALAVAHPLVRRGLSLRTAYVHGEGGPQVTVELESDQDVAGVVRDWWESRENQEALTGPEARARLERSLSTDGNVFIASYTNPVDGRVTNRTIPLEEITRIITAPGDRMQVMFYERQYTRRAEAFATTEQAITTLHPALSYAPSLRPRVIDGKEVRWDEPIRHVRVNELDGWQFGVGDTFSIASWARAYRDFLGDWAKLTKSLSQFAWRATAEGKRASKARQALQRAQTSVPGNSGSAGATYVSQQGESLEAIPKSGATIDADSGRPLLAMIAAGLDVPVTMLSTDPGVTGARATAETLDEPMYRAMNARQDVWGRLYTDLAEYRIEQAIRRPGGALTGAVVRDAWTNTDHAELDGAVPVIHVDWPDLSTESKRDAIAAVKDADATRKLPPLTIARQLLTALGVDDIDEVMAEITDEETGEWRDPYAQIGQRLVNAFNSGQDPAQALQQYGRFPADTEQAEALIRRGRGDA